MDISPPLLHGVGHPPFYQHHPPIYNVKIYRTKLTELDRLGSGVRVSASFHIFDVTAGREIS